MPNAAVTRFMVLLAAPIVGCIGCGTLPRPIPVSAPTTDAIKYCQEIEHGARGLSRGQAYLGWGLVTASLSAIATGTIIIATRDNLSNQAKALSLGLPAAGAILGYAAQGAFERSAQDGALAAYATMALNDPATAARTCNEGLAVWNTSRADASSAVVTALKAKLEAERAGEKADRAMDAAAKTETKVETVKDDVKVLESRVPPKQNPYP